MNLLEIPHFVRGKDINNCIKKLLAVMHRSNLWLDGLVSNDFELIEKIIGHPTYGEKPVQYLDDKTN
jgi:hypothetical protein